jgi:hypothetical protein
MTERKTPLKAKPGLMGRGFHTINNEGDTNWQGEIIAELGDGYYLAQLFDWFGGHASTQYIFHINELSSKTPDGKPRFRFFTDMSEANSYMDVWARPRDERIRREKEKQPAE